LVTDRFAKTVDDGGPCDSAARKYCNGTWKGIINHLDYIQGMGFDAVWISPITENIEQDTAYGQAYHGYWPQNLNNLNSHFGTPDDLKALSDALHKRGMYLMVDIVVNHIAATATPPSLTYTNYTPFDTQTDYHPFCWVKNYDNQTEVEQCSIGDTTVALVDLDTENQTVVNTYQTWIKNLVQTYSIDGLRLDTAKHVRQSFWPDFLKSAGVFAVAEILDPRANYTGAYTNYIDTVFNYPQWWYLKYAFANVTGDIPSLVQNVKDTQSMYKNGAMSTVSFSENHDNARLPSEIGDPMDVKSIITWTFANDGIPCLYYGQEAGYSGGNDPMNREALWFTSYSTSVSLYKYINTLNAVRKLAIADKNSKFLSTAANVVSSTNKHIALYKAPLLTAMTNAGNVSQTIDWTITGTGYKGGVQLVDLASGTCDVVTVANDGSVPIAFNNGAPKVYLPTTVLSSTGPCGSKAQPGGGPSSNSNNKSAAVQLQPAVLTSGVVAMVTGMMAWLVML
ncbi:hypothetical protein FRB99_002796, partial [Tulasnella sp. 403]